MVTARYRKLEIDIGCGHGHFLVQAAKENPSTLYVGIDINERNCELAEATCKTHGLTNAIVCHAEAAQFISAHIPNETVDAFHIYFPSPYLKEIRRHNVLGKYIRGRLISDPFISDLQRAAKISSSCLAFPSFKCGCLVSHQMSPKRIRRTERKATAQTRAGRETSPHFGAALARLAGLIMALLKFCIRLSNAPEPC